VLLTDGRLLPADTVIVSIGDAPDLSAIPEDIARERGFVTVNQFGQTTDPRVFAIGDVVRLGLLTQAIGDGRRVAETIDGIHRGTRPLSDTAEIADAQALRHEVMDPGNLLSETIDTTRMHLAYFDPRRASFGSVEECASECASCGLCRDCGTCEAICPRGAISRQSLPDGGFAMVSDPKRCIGCGFCADSCPCGIWHMVPNTPMG
jgi:ferredoxin